MKTALITGATGGIGLEIAKLFAQNGISLILVARNQESLQAIAKQLTVYPIEVRIYAKDLSVIESAKHIYDDIKANHLTVDYLVNNAGFGINDRFVDIEWEKEVQMYTLNMLTLAYFTKVFATEMKSQKFGRILNIGSTGSFQPGPYMAGYCATKAFVLSLSEAVNHELRGTNVSVSTLCPGVTDTKFHAVAQTEETGMSKLLPHASAEKVAQYGYRLMMKGQSMGVQGLMNKLIVFSNRLTCRKLVVVLSGKLLKK